MSMLRFRFNVWLGEWIQIAEALVGIVTLSYVRPPWSLQWFDYWYK